MGRDTEIGARVTIVTPGSLYRLALVLQLTSLGPMLQHDSPPGGRA